MQDRYSTTTVRSYSSGTQGRALVNAGTNHFIIDGPGGEALGSRGSLPVRRRRLRR